MSNLIILPKHFKPRPYQLPTFEKYFKEGCKRFIYVWHRRAGKDQVWLHWAIAAAQLKVATYVHALPTIAQAKKVVWRNIDEQGHTLFDYIPQELLKHKPNATDLYVEFKNGSILQLVGADNFDSLRGTNPWHITFSEYSFTHPMAWGIIEPILIRNGGSASFIFTPNGQNHAYDFYEANKNNPDFYTTLLTVDDTREWDGSYIVSPESIESMRRSGTSEDFIQREFYCSFNVFQGGVYFAKEYKEAIDNNRILDFPINRDYPIDTYWDLGVSDSTAIWFIQHIPEGYKAVNYYEYNNVGFEHYANYLDKFKNENHIVYGKHYAPHDAAQRDKFSAERYVDKAQRLGVNFEIVPRVTSKTDAIELVRGVFNQVTFQKTNCEYGLKALQSYHTEYNEKLKTYSDTPCHDWSSHGVDAFMQFAQSYKTSGRNNLGVLYNRVNSKSLYKRTN